MTPAARVAWAAIWLSAAHCWRIDSLQLLRVGYSWASRRTRSMRKGSDLAVLVRARRLARLAEQAQHRAEVALYGTGMSEADQALAHEIARTA